MYREVESFLIIGAVAAFCGGIVWLENRSTKKRKKELFEWAAEHDFTTYEYPPGILPLVEDKNMALFDLGGNPAYQSVISRESEGRDEFVFDFSYVVSSGKSSHTVSQTICAFRVNQWDLPSFSMGPEKIYHKLGQVFGYQDIDFKESRKFSSNYLLRGSDEQAIRLSFGVALLDYFGANRNWFMDAHGDWLFIFRRSHWYGTIEVSDLKSYHDETRRILEYFLEGKPGGN
ncbi:MAG: hypothetical protein COB53_07365 [Elusimicrobia bacterium]|nr:MAG: hypothetical protein COB53_07365 [Elusimicrobiota bacterium]